MSTETEVQELVINKLTKAQYEASSKSNTELYFVTDEDYYAKKTDLNTKQNVISDLESIRSGAELGATALQSVPSEYITRTELSNHHDSTKQDKLPTLVNGKFLTNNGSTLSWADVDGLPSQTGNEGKFLTTNGTTASWAEVKSSGTTFRDWD